MVAASIALGVEGERAGGGDVHRHVAAEAGERLARARRFERDDDADAAESVDDLAVNVMADGALGDMQPVGAAQRDVLADGGDGVGDRLGDRAAAGIMRALTALRVDAGALVERDRDDPAHQRLEVVVARDEIGLRIDLDDDAEIGLDRDADQAVGGDPAALLGRLGQALLAQPVDGGFDVAAGLGERGLAVHHARAGLSRSSFTSAAEMVAMAIFPQIDSKKRIRRAYGGLDCNLFSGGGRPAGRRRAVPRPSPASGRGDGHAAAISVRACSTQLSRATRPLSLRSASSLSASALVIAATCQ